jgi:hypothetical protein
MKKVLVVLAIILAVIVNVTVAQEKQTQKKGHKVVVAKTDKKADTKDCANCKDAATCEKGKAAKTTESKDCANCKDAAKCEKADKKDVTVKETKKGGPNEEKNCCDKK